MTSGTPPSHVRDGPGCHPWMTELENATPPSGERRSRASSSPRISPKKSSNTSSGQDPGSKHRQHRIDIPHKTLPKGLRRADFRSSRKAASSTPPLRLGIRNQATPYRERHTVARQSRSQPYTMTTAKPPTREWQQTWPTPSMGATDSGVSAVS
jgi:hypothetical protein